MTGYRIVADEIVPMGPDAWDQLRSYPWVPPCAALPAGTLYVAGRQGGRTEYARLIEALLARTPLVEALARTPSVEANIARYRRLLDDQ